LQRGCKANLGGNDVPNPSLLRGEGGGEGEKINLDIYKEK
jgi:hypothetical protein